MNNQSIKSIINHFENNFREYYSLLNPLRAEGTVSHEPNADNDLCSFLCFLTTMEEEVIEFRLKKLLKEEHPYMPSIDTSFIERNAAADKHSLSQIIANFLRKRQELIKLLYSTPAPEWERTGVLGEEGHVTFEDLIMRFIKKDEHNIPIIRNKIVNE